MSEMKVDFNQLRELLNYRPEPVPIDSFESDFQWSEAWLLNDVSFSERLRNYTREWKGSWGLWLCKYKLQDWVRNIAFYNPYLMPAWQFKLIVGSINREDSPLHEGLKGVVLRNLMCFPSNLNDIDPKDIAKLTELMNREDGYVDRKPSKELVSMVSMYNGITLYADWSDWYSTVLLGMIREAESTYQGRVSYERLIYPNRVILRVDGKLGAYFHSVPLGKDHVEIGELMEGGNPIAGCEPWDTKTVLMVGNPEEIDNSCVANGEAEGIDLYCE